MSHFIPCYYTDSEAVSKVIMFFENLQFESTDTVKTPKSPEGDFKAAPSGEVWRGKLKVNLQFESFICEILTFDTTSGMSALQKEG
jgi:hypothetical protein